MISAPKGTKDVLPQESYKWHFVENVVREITKTFGFREIRTPTFEHTELFLRGVGETTDVVNKEMYTFEDKGGRSITLKPEGTAGVARSFIENALVNNPQPSKMFYLTSVFRYEKPQAGRLREHHQFGVELYGSRSHYADAEVISLAYGFFSRLGLGEKVTLHINSIGCKSCRKDYSAALKRYFEDKKSDLCPTCLERLEKNPLRILDCKVEDCKKIAENAPVVLDYLCDECKEHHEKLQRTLRTLKIPFSVNPKIVRGLDYYTRTVFEFVTDVIGSQGTVCGGGRYNDLVEEIGGTSVPAVGFGLGIERLLLVLENAGCTFGINEDDSTYIAPLGEDQYEYAQYLAQQLREKGIPAQTDLMEKSLKAQMKYADKCGFRYVVVLGEDEIKSGEIVRKEMQTKECVKMTIEELLKGGRR